MLHCIRSKLGNKRTKLNDCLAGLVVEFAHSQHNIQPINPFHVIGLFLYPLRTSEKLLFYRKTPTARNGLNKCFHSYF